MRRRSGGSGAAFFWAASPTTLSDTMKKRILILAVLALVAVVAVLGGIKGLQIDRMIAHGKQMVPPAEAVTTATAVRQSWESVLTAVGSLSAVQGVTLSAELTGKVAQIAFTPGGSVKAGDLLVKQDTSSEEAQLRSAEAGAALARLNIERLGKLLVEKTIAQSQYDNAEAALQAGHRAGGHHPRHHRQEDDPRAVRRPPRHPAGQPRPGDQRGPADRVAPGPGPDLRGLLPAAAGPAAAQDRAARARDHRRASGGGVEGRSPPSTRRSTPPPAPSACRRPSPTRTSACGRGCSSTWRWCCRRPGRCSSSRPRPCSTLPTATRSSSSRTGRPGPAGSRARSCASSSRSSGTGRAISWPCTRA